MTTTETTFSTSWSEWRKEWTAWYIEHEADLKPTRKRFPGKNFLADEILGTWNINGRAVELSEVTFPNLEERNASGRLRDFTVRSIGITYEEGSGPVVRSFAALEHELGIA